MSITVRLRPRGKEPPSCAPQGAGMKPLAGKRTEQDAKGKNPVGYKQPNHKKKNSERKQAPTHNEAQVEFNVIPGRTTRANAARPAHSYGLLVAN